MNQQDFSGFLVFHQHRGGSGHGVARLVIGELLAPDHFSGVFIQRDDAGIEGTEEHLVTKDRGAPPVDHVAAGTNTLGRR